MNETIKQKLEIIFKDTYYKTWELAETHNIDAGEMTKEINANLFCLIIQFCGSQTPKFIKLVEQSHDNLKREYDDIDKYLETAK